MDYYSLIVYLVGLACGAVFWMPRDIIVGQLIYQLYFVASGKIHGLLGILDEDYMYDELVVVYGPITPYAEYIGLVHEYVPTAPRRIAKSSLRLLSLFARRFLIPFIPALIIFFREAHMLLLGFGAYLILRFIIHYIAVIRVREPELIARYVAHDVIVFNDSRGEGKV